MGPLARHFQFKGSTDHLPQNYNELFVARPYYLCTQKPSGPLNDKTLDKSLTALADKTLDGCFQNTCPCAADGKFVDSPEVEVLRFKWPATK